MMVTQGRKFGHRRKPRTRFTNKVEGIIRKERTEVDLCNWHSVTDLGSDEAQEDQNEDGETKMVAGMNENRA
jgi:hypothetical protein